MKNLAHGLNMTMERCLCSEIFRFLSFKPKQPFLTCNWLETPQPIHSLHNYQLKINVFIHIFKFYYSLLAFLQSFLGVFFTKALYIFPRGFITVADQCAIARPYWDMPNCQHTLYEFQCQIANIICPIIHFVEAKTNQ